MRFSIEKDLDSTNSWMILELRELPPIIGHSPLCGRSDFTLFALDGETSNLPKNWFTT